MGNQTENAKDNQQIFESNIKHPKLASAKFIQPKNDTPYLEISQTVQCRDIYDKWKIVMSKYRSLQVNEVQTILLPKQVKFEEKGLCGSSGVIIARYPVLPYVLSQQIINRTKIKQPFYQKELWYLLYTTNMAGMIAHSGGTVLGDVRPQNIMMSQYGQILICCLGSFIDDEKNYYKALTLKLKTYLAPQQIRDLQKGKDSCIQNQPISQCFSIGLTMLAAILLKDQAELYSIQYNFDQELLMEQIYQLQNKRQYNKLLRQIIQAMLVVDMSERLTCKQVVTLLKPYQNLIISLQTFQFDSQSMSNQLKQRIHGTKSVMRKSISNEYLKVINNNDFNKNSRVKYIQSPRGSNIIQNQGQTIVPPLPHVLISQLSNGQPQPQILTSPVIHRQQMHRANTPEKLFVQGPRPNIQHIQYPMPYQQKLIQPNVIRTTHQNPNNINQHIYQPVVSQNSTISDKHSPSLINYRSDISSFIPDQYQQVMSFKKQQEPRTQKKTSNIVGAKMVQSTINVQQSSFNKSNYYDTKFRDKKFDHYDQVMSNFDQKLRLSRKSFPDDV